MQSQSDKDRFKNYLRKIGSGQETGRSLNRRESADALKLLLNKIPTPAQIGAFLIAHRIKRPTSRELAGMIDTYKTLGPKLQSGKRQKDPIFFGMPFDGRKRTSPIYPLTTLILLSSGQPVVLQGGKRMPVNYGVTTQELFEAIGLNLKNLNIQQVQDGFIKNNFAFIYQPDHFSLADNLISFREEIGKRIPIASLELIWCVHQGAHLHVSGYVHSPTEERHLKTLELIGETKSITIKGLEGSIDIPIGNKCQIGRSEDGKQTRFEINPKEFNYFRKDVNWRNIEEWQKAALETLDNRGPLIKSVLWNAGVYLWLNGNTEDLTKGINKAESLIRSGAAKKTLEQLINWRSNI